MARIASDRQLPLLFADLRTCRHCGIDKPLADFVRNGIYRRHECRACWRQYVRQQRQRVVVAIDWGWWPA